MKKKIKIISVILFVTIFTIAIFVDVRGSFLEYNELGEKYASVFLKNVTYKSLITLINFVGLFLIIYLTGRSIKKGLKVFFDEEKKEIPKLPNKSIALIVSGIVSIIIGNIFVNKIILAIEHPSFEQNDGVFGYDISFFVFVLPLLKQIILYGIIICIGIILYSAIYYILAFNKYFDGINRQTLKQSLLIKKVIKYVRIIAIFLGILIILRVFDIVDNNFITTGSGLELIGAGLTDVTVKIVGNIILAIVLCIEIFLGTASIKNGKNSKALKNIVSVPIYMVLMFVVMFGFDIIFVNSNKYDKEKKYIERNMAHTKSAYGLNYDEETIKYSGTIKENEVEENRNIINNAVTISKDLVIQHLNESQTEKGYYTHPIANIYEYNGEITYLAPKEISTTRRTFNSRTYEYTHGYGIALASATSLSEEGEPIYFETELATPQIYYGLETNNIAIINRDGAEEYDYTDNQDIEYTSKYNGNSGIILNFMDRLVLATKKAIPGIAISGKMTDNSKILINRNIISRAKMVLNGYNIVYDENPYMVIGKDKKLYWILDAYTISENYPYSTYRTIQNNGERRKINYIKNSIKVIINSYDGNMNFYITDDTDPIALAFKKIYPNVFSSKDELYDDVKEHFIYPEFLYNIQSSILEDYHDMKPETLYRGDDSWKKATYVTIQNNKSTTNTLNSYYTQVKYDETEKIGLIQIYSPNGKQNLTSYLIGVSENGENKLKMHKISASENILGLTQLDNKISQDEVISKEIEKLDVMGAKITKRIMVIPIADTLLYVEQIYQTKTNEVPSMPKLKKVIVSSGNKVAIGNNLKEAVENIVSKYATNIDTFTTEDLDGLIQSIIKANNNLKDSMESKDLELIGSDVKKLQELINMLESEQEKQKENKIEEENTIESNLDEENKIKDESVTENTTPNN